MAGTSNRAPLFPSSWYTRKQKNLDMPCFIVWLSWNFRVGTGIWPPPEWARIGKISGTRNFELGFLQFMIAGFDYDRTIMDKEYIGKIMCGLKISTVCICHNEQLYPDPRILMDCCQLRFREWDIEMMTGICERVEIWNGFFRRDQWYMGVCIVLGDVYQGIADLSSLPSFCQKLHWRCCR